MEQQLLNLNSQFKTGVKAQQARTKRKWMELNALTNRHALVFLPYEAMLSHLGRLVEERKKYFEASTGILPPLSLQEKGSSTPKYASQNASSKAIDEPLLVESLDNLLISAEDTLAISAEDTLAISAESELLIRTDDDYLLLPNYRTHSKR